MGAVLLEHALLLSQAIVQDEFSAIHVRCGGFTCYLMGSNRDSKGMPQVVCKTTQCFKAFTHIS
jgi:hypothetical protein